MRVRGILCDRLGRPMSLYLGRRVRVTEPTQVGGRNLHRGEFEIVAYRNDQQVFLDLGGRSELVPLSAVTVLDEPGKPLFLPKAERVDSTSSARVSLRRQVAGLGTCSRRWTAGGSCCTPARYRVFASGRAYCARHVPPDTYVEELVDNLPIPRPAPLHPAEGSRR